MDNFLLDKLVLSNLNNFRNSWCIMIYSFSLLNRKVVVVIDIAFYILYVSLRYIVDFFCNKNTYFHNTDELTIQEEGRYQACTEHIDVALLFLELVPSLYADNQDLHNAFVGGR
jgi:hypothetical protein